MKLIRRNEFVIEASPTEIADLLMSDAGPLALGAKSNRWPAEQTNPEPAYFLEDLQPKAETRASRDVLLARDVSRVLAAREEGSHSDAVLLELLARSWRQHQNQHPDPPAKRESHELY